MPLRESDTVELKREVVPDICKEVIALANTKGGTIYIGIADDGDIIGVHDADAVMLQVNNMVRDAVKPDVTMFVSYDVEDMDGRQVIRIGVQRGTNRPYYLGSKGLKPSGVYVRHGTSTDPATDSAIRQMIKESDGDSYAFLGAGADFYLRRKRICQAWYGIGACPNENVGHAYSGEYFYQCGVSAF